MTRRSAAEIRMDRSELHFETGFAAGIMHVTQLKQQNRLLRELVEYVLACEGNDYKVDEAWVARAEATLGPPPAQQ